MISEPRVDFLRRTESGVAAPAVSAPIAGPIATVDFVEPNLNLLAHAQTIELEIGSRCGGHGKCGGDRVRILPGVDGSPNLSLSPVTEDERRHLSSDEISQGFRLACQCFPNDARVSLRLEIG